MDKTKTPAFLRTAMVGLRPLVTSASVLVAVLAGCAAPKDFAGTANCDDTPVSSVTHVHGLAVSPTNSRVVFVATHHGLFKLLDDERFVRVGTVTWDLMGFSLHPDDPGIAWSSGHARPSAPNIGVARTEDGGCTWKVVGLKGLVDFHALAVSPANPDLLFGQYDLFYTSSNGAKRWTSVRGAPGAFAVAPHPEDTNIVLMATKNGLYRSEDVGRTWQAVASLPGLVTGVAYARADPDIVLAYVAGQGLVRSDDGGESWERHEFPTTGQEVGLHFAPDPRNAAVFYAATSQSRLFKTEDGGESWAQVPHSG